MIIIFTLYIFLWFLSIGKVKIYIPFVRFYNNMRRISQWWLSATWTLLKNPASVWSPSFRHCLSRSKKGRRGGRSAKVSQQHQYCTNENPLIYCKKLLIKVRKNIVNTRWFSGEMDKWPVGLSKAIHICVFINLVKV